MKLVFIGTHPSALLRNSLLTNGFIVEEHKTTPKKGKPDLQAELVMLGPGTPPKAPDIELLQVHFPKAWRVVIAHKTWLGKPMFQNFLLNCEALDDMWLKSSWEQTLLYSIHRMAKYRELEEKVAKLEEQARTRRSEAEQLAAHSKKLIKQFERDVDLAANLQRSLLPKKPPDIPGISIGVKYLPSQGMGGDYYDIFEFGDKKRFGILIADSKSHGMAAALLSVLIKVRLEEMKDRYPDSKSFVEFLNRQIQEVHQKEIASLNLLYGILDRSSLTFQYTVAGNLQPILWRLGESPPLATAANPTLGGVDHYAFRENFITLKPADLLIFYTDGLEVPLGRGEAGAQKRILDVLKSQRDPSPDPLELQNEVMGLIDRFTDQQALPDDLTLIQLSIDERALYLAPENQPKGDA